MSSALRRSALAAAVFAALPASAVTLNPDGLGQALIYPYYTAQSAGNDAFNTYLSVVNHTPDAKALRLRFREGRLGKSVLDMNVYLSPNDVWTGAVIPFSTGTRLVSADVSCTEPRFAVTVAPGEAPFIDFRNDAFASGTDGAGTGLDRTREGFVEILEMATLTGASAFAVTHNSAGVPSNCAAIQAGTPLVAAPSGGLSGTLTLINVANGIDFTLNAEALDGLAQRAYFRPASDPYPDFNAAEIDPVSVVTANGATYRSTWSRPVDAVSALLVRPTAMAEYVLDQATASLTDVVLTLPTRHYYPSGSAPFTRPLRWNPACTVNGSPLGESLAMLFFGREERSGVASQECGFLCPPSTPAPAVCASAGVMTVRNNALLQFNGLSTSITPVFGSFTQGLSGGGSAGIVNVTSNSIFQAGWLDIRATEANAMTSGAASTTLRHATGESVTGPQTFRGLPVVGFSARIFRNGSLKCDAGTCQGNYGGAFPFKYRRLITPAS